MRLSVQDVYKKYGKVQALSGVSLELEPGVYGLLGPNGAGKSTLIQIMTGNLDASGGTVFYEGKNIRKSSKQYKQVLGYVPQSQGIYEMFTANEFLEYMSILKGIRAKERKAQIQSVLDIVGLSEVRKRKLGGFSGGMKQRILIAQALLGNPKIIILDEPTAGLDPKERINIRNFISKIAEDKIILVATHVVSDIETIAKEIICLGKGNVAAQGTPKELCERLDGEVWECTVDVSMYEQIESRVIVSNLRELPEGMVRVRFIGAKEQVSQLFEGCVEFDKVFPDLQDVYLSVFV